MRTPESGHDTRKLSKRAKSGLAGVTLATVSLLPSACSSDSVDAAPAPTVTITKTLEVAPAPIAPDLKERNEKVHAGSIEIAKKFVSILADKRSTTTEGYRGNYVGNKDDKRPNDVVEGFMIYDQETGRIVLRGTQSYDSRTGKPADEKTPLDAMEFTSIAIVFDVSTGNTITEKNHQLQIGDFDRALSQPGTLDFVSMSGDWYDPNSQSVTAYSLENNDGVLEVRVNDNARGEGDPLDDDATKMSSFEGYQRALQLAGASLDQLHGEM